MELTEEHACYLKTSTSIYEIAKQSKHKKRDSYVKCCMILIKFVAGEASVVTIATSDTLITFIDFYHKRDLKLIWLVVDLSCRDLLCVGIKRSFFKKLY